MRAAPDDPITVLPGIAAKKEALYRTLSIRSVRQLVLHLPRRYLDLRATEPLDEVTSNDGLPHLVRARVLSKSNEQRIRKGFSIFRLRC